MKINILQAIKPAAKKGLQVTNEIGSTTRAIAATGKNCVDSFIKNNKCTSSIINTAKKAGINKDTVIGAAVAAAAITLATEAFITSKNKIKEIIQKN